MANPANLAFMAQDEQAIRDLIATWHIATVKGDFLKGLAFPSSGSP